MTTSYTTPAIPGFCYCFAFGPLWLYVSYGKLVVLGISSGERQLVFLIQSTICLLTVRSKLSPH